MRAYRKRVAIDPGCVKTLRGITVPGILGSVVMRRARNIKICLLLGMTTKSDFVFAQPRPISVISDDFSLRCTAQLFKARDISATIFDVFSRQF